MKPVEPPDNSNVNGPLVIRTSSTRLGSRGSRIVLRPLLLGRGDSGLRRNSGKRGEVRAALHFFRFATEQAGDEFNNPIVQDKEVDATDEGPTDDLRNWINHPQRRIENGDQAEPDEDGNDAHDRPEGAPNLLFAFFRSNLLHALIGRYVAEGRAAAARAQRRGPWVDLSAVPTVFRSRAARSFSSHITLALQADYYTSRLSASGRDSPSAGDMP